MKKLFRHWWRSHDILGTDVLRDHEKREGLVQLEAALKDAKPVQFKQNIALVLKYFDKLAPIMQEQDLKLRPAD